MSLGHAAFFGIAGYCLALISPQYQAANFWTSLPLWMLVAGVLALAIGALQFEPVESILIMVTLAFAPDALFACSAKLAVPTGCILMSARRGLFASVRSTPEKFGHFYFVSARVVA